jgi:hypothetical protein
VTFSEPVRSGDGAPGDAASPQSYRLIGAGSNLDLETAGCAGESGDDRPVAIDAVDYDAASRTATLDLNGGEPLSDGPHRLLVCGTIEDLVGNPLAAGDFPLSFRVDRFNLFDNGHFDACTEPPLDSWSTVEEPPNEVSRSDEDAEGAEQSGSARVMGAGAGVSAIAQCRPLAAGATYRLRARLSVSLSGGTVVVYTQRCEFFAAPDCEGGPIDQTVTAVLADEPTDGWPVVESRFIAPAAADSTLCSFAVEPLTVEAPDFDLYLDDLFLSSVVSGVIFADGFESGDLGRWSSRSP